MITLYNTLTRQKEEFRPIEEGKVRMYVCGPTVYDVPHIGHARSAYIFDFIRKYFEYTGLEVFFVRNVTDIDDKIINKAVQELKDIGENISAPRLAERVKEVAERYLKVYHQELDILGISSPTEEPRATLNIPQMITFIEKLIKKGTAYVSGKNVYFSVQKFKGYGKLSNRDIEQMMQGVRIDVDERKEHPLDFALWKEAKEYEPFWDSPWGKGRPGWHIECSVMSTRILGPQFDIHGGGLDLIFPHHENEIAQAEAATGMPFANYWIHNGLLSVNGEKMSKSLGNYITISDFLEKYHDPDLIKIAFLSSHYRSPMDFSEERMREAAKTKERIMIFFDKVDRAAREDAGRKGGEGADGEVLAKAQEAVNSLQEKFNAAMNDDFNTAAALSAIFEAIKTGNEYFSNEQLPASARAHLTVPLKKCILRLAHVFGLSFKPEKIERDESEEIERLVALREDARKAKDYAEADKIRAELDGMGVVVEDTPEGPVWRKS